MVTTADTEHDQVSELRAFDETKAGVKGLVDAGITQVPHIFVRLPDSMACSDDRVDIPVINLGCANAGPACHKETVQNIGQAMGKWDFVQVINHGVHESLLEEVIEGHAGSLSRIQRPRKDHTPEILRKGHVQQQHALYNSIAADWRDSIFCSMGPEPPSPSSCPKLAVKLEDFKRFMKTSGSNVPPIAGALMINIEDLLELIMNDQFKSVEHRVMANKRGPRVSVACFFGHTPQPSSRLYGPIKELTPADNPPIYNETTLPNYTAHYISQGVRGTSALPDFKL
ncbi:1-aminocyclopropane-1-carboxylate oxidase homolog [Eucalyptus grandis]|uniref:1-aminocyclopropane-1-carboxylate oxidase homolog n=1 Tax=Eucalyptus grandis TaxID=71139 RepID=UPI00192EEC56|nr:1-aminocyclopropane-1-carboxylate oxidase homolog [Eucalyptus grandis]